MPNNKDPSADHFDSLRDQATKLIRQRPAFPTRWPSDAAELLHELCIHQAELEIQNDELRLAQNELSSLHREYQDLYEFAPCGYITLNENGLISRANLTAVALLGAERSRLAHSTFSRFLTPGWEHPYLEARQKAFETGRKQSLELPLKGEAEDWPWVRADIEAETDEAGSLKRWRMVLLDVSQRRQAEARLDQARLEAFLQLNRMHESGIRELIAQALQESLRLTGSEVAFITFLCDIESSGLWTVLARRESAEPEFLPSVASTAALSGYEPWSEALRQREPVMVNAAPSGLADPKSLPEGMPPLRRFLSIPVLDGERVVAVAVLGNKAADYDQADVSKLRLFMEDLWQVVRRKQAEQALQDSEQRYRNMFASSPLGIFHAGLEGRLVEVNPALAAMLGFASPESALAEICNVNDLMDAPAGNGPAGCLDRLLSTDTCQQLNHFRRKDGSELIANIYLKTVRDGQDEPLFLEGLVEDVTERKLAEREKDELQAQLLQAQKMETVGRLAGGVAHEINNLLQGMLGYVQLLQMKSSHGLSSTYLQRLGTSIFKARDIVNTLLTISRKKEVRFQEIQLNTVVRETVDFLSRTMPGRLTLSLRLARDLPLIEADPTQISQVLINLLKNSCEAIGPDCPGSIEIETAVRQDPPSGRMEPEGSPSVLLSLADTGQGMNQEVQEHVFEPFFTTKEVGQGTGLGLSTVYSIVQAHSGEIRFSSRAGHGTRFVINLPCRQLEPDQGP